MGISHDVDKMVVFLSVSSDSLRLAANRLSDWDYGGEV